MGTAFFKARTPGEMPASWNQACVVLGNLDGLHLGHQELLRRARELAGFKALPMLVFTFDPHPMEVLPGKPDFRRIFPRDAQTDLLQKMGADGVYYQDFNAEFARTTAEDFLNQYLMLIAKPKVIVVGFNFRFGQNRQGTPEYLEQWGLKHNVQIIIVPPFQVAGQIVSSSSIRQFLQSGDIHRAQLLLGFPFFVDGIVEKGAQRGRNLGFPTANVHWSTTLVPKFGVYATRTHYRGQSLRSVSHLGPVPTFGEDRPRLETHILDQNLSLYGEHLRIEFLERLRDPVKFAGLDELKAQIQKDIQAAREIHESRGDS